MLGGETGWRSRHGVEREGLLYNYRGSQLGPSDTAGGYHVSILYFERLRIWTYGHYKGRKLVYIAIQIMGGKPASYSSLGWSHCGFSKHILHT